MLHAVCPEPGDRVDGPVVDPDLGVQVRSGGLALVADQGDRLAGLDRPAAHQDPADVPVDRGDAATVAQDHLGAEAAGRTGVEDDAVAHRVDRRAVGGADVDAVVEQHDVLDRVHPRPEARADVPHDRDHPAAAGDRHAVVLHRVDRHRRHHRARAIAALISGSRCGIDSSSPFVPLEAELDRPVLVDDQPDAGQRGRREGAHLQREREGAPASAPRRRAAARRRGRPRARPRRRRWRPPARPARSPPCPSASRPGRCWGRRPSAIVWPLPMNTVPAVTASEALALVTATSRSRCACVIGVLLTTIRCAGMRAFSAATGTFARGRRGRLDVDGAVVGLRHDHPAQRARAGPRPPAGTAKP